MIQYRHVHVCVGDGAALSRTLRSNPLGPAPTWVMETNQNRLDLAEADLCLTLSLTLAQALPLTLTLKLTLTPTLTQVMETNHNGLDIAEADLHLRGAGSVFNAGIKQSGEQTCVCVCAHMCVRT